MLDFPVHRPVCKALERYIDYYYFFESADPAFGQAYFAFPHTSTALNLHRRVSFAISDSAIYIEGTHAGGCHAFITQVRRAPLRVEWRGRMDKVTIAFKPLGLHNFVAAGELPDMTGQVQLFDHCTPALGTAVFAAATAAEKVSAIEAFLLSVWHPLPEQQLLEKAIALLAVENDLAISEIAARTGLHSRALNRLFNRFLGVPPVTYRQIAQFRRSMESRLFADEVKRLTAIAYESHFYDQSHFIRVYNKLTGTHPGAFFDSIDRLAGGQLVLRFIADRIVKKIQFPA